MKKDQIKLGGTYMAKVTDKVVPVRLDAENPHGGWDATNLVTNKKVRIKSAQRLRGEAKRNQDGQAPPEAAEKTTTPETKPAKTAKTTKTKAPATPKVPGAAKVPKAEKVKKEKKTSGLDAAALVLKAAGHPVNCKDMVAIMLENHLWKTSGKTPAATIYAAIVREIATKKGDSRFKKTDRGLFTLNPK